VIEGENHRAKLARFLGRRPASGNQGWTVEVDSVLRGVLHMVDDEDVDRAGGRLQLETELFL
jgi:hypothetical protein